MSDPDLSIFNEFAFQTKLDQLEEEEIWRIYREQQKHAAAEEEEIEYIEDLRKEDEEFSLLNYSEELDIRPVADNPGLYKVMSTGAVVNMDSNSYNMYVQNKKRSDYLKHKQEETNNKVDKWM